MLIPVALLLGLVGLLGFLWALKNGQFDDMDGAAYRILFDEDDVRPSEKDAVSEKDSIPEKKSAAERDSAK